MTQIARGAICFAIGVLLAVSSFIFSFPSANADQTTSMVFPHQTGTLWSPYLEWSLPSANFSGNPFDVVATVTFVHTESGERRVTEMFYAGDDAWKFRFAGTRVGEWRFTTASANSDLHGHSGTISIEANPGAAGFVTHIGNKWVRMGTGQAFVPQFVMVSGPQNYLNNPARVDAEIQTFLVEHGFNGFHTPVFCRWFDIDTRQCGQISGSSPNPDLRTFAALELLITKTYEAGGVVHIWLWGDDSRQENPNFLPGGINGPVDRRLQRYIAARLGPLPGWTVGYGYDLFEWVNGAQLTAWHDYMQAHMGWEHYLGARSGTNQLTQPSETMDYSSYEQHRPDYAKYVQTIEMRPDKPSFSEDRFRIRTTHPYKDYDMVMTRQGLWRSAMAGGVANIWGNLLNNNGANDGSATSLPFPNPEWIRTYADFIDAYFFADMERCNELTNGVCLKRPNQNDYLFYREDTTSVRLDLRGMTGQQTAVAVDTASANTRIQLGQLTPIDQTWNAPYLSDWAIAVGSFDQPHCLPISYAGSGPKLLLPAQAQGAHMLFLPMVQGGRCP
jgi:hypothetical protein